MPAPFIEDAFLFPLNNVSFFVKNQMFIGVWINVRVFNSISLVHLSVVMPIPACFQYSSSVVEFEVRDGDSSRNYFIVYDCFGHSGFFVFPYEVECGSFEVCEEFCWALH